MGEAAVAGMSLIPVGGLGVIESVIYTLIGLGTIILAAWKVGRPVARWLTLVVASWRRLIDSTKKTNALVQYELSPNGGESVRDMVAYLVERAIVTDERWRVMLEHNHAPMFETDASGAWTRANRRLSHRLRRTSGELLGSNWINAIDEVQRAAVAKSWKSSVAQRREFQGTIAFVTPLGERVEARAHAMPLFDKSGELIAYVGVLEEEW